VLIFVCFVIVGMTASRSGASRWTRPPRPADQILFVCGALIGAAGGALQAASRTMMVRHTTPDRATEAFGLFALSGKVASFIAPALIALATMDQRIAAHRDRSAHRVVPDRVVPAKLGPNRRGEMTRMMPEPRRSADPSLAAPAQAEKLANQLFGAMDLPSAQDPCRSAAMPRAARRGWWNCRKPGRPGRRCGCRATATSASR
jgi:hypothetical protein